jgi:hypothetical protein
VKKDASWGLVVGAILGMVACADDVPPETPEPAPWGCCEALLGAVEALHVGAVVGVERLAAFLGARVYQPRR